MHKRVCYIIQRVLATTRPRVTILVAIAFQAAIDAGKHAEAAEIELALVHEERVVDVLLDDESLIALFTHRSSNDSLHVF